ncbi:MAG: hypothetical protein RBT70_03995 [Alphaproteobacteria bacterium]|jgi:nicotinate phosphoribosyltransferase|nr:hypothetical protein [Alphaproteobacteria bacterium]
MKTQKIPDYERLARPKGYQSFLPTIGPVACDLYALTMTYAMWKLEMVDKIKATANVFGRSLMNNGDMIDDQGEDTPVSVKVPYLVNSGLGLAAEWYDGWKWKDRELGYLATLQVDDGKGDKMRLFPNDFLYWLSKQKMTLDIKAVPEGEIIMPHEPIKQITGPVWQALAIEAMTLSLDAVSTNLATVATQIRLATQREALKEGAELVDASTHDIERAGLAEMALRRSPCIAGLPSARAAYIGGWDSSSNVYAGMCYGIPVMGTFAHAWVMLHDTEEQAFENWAKVFPGATVFLADTYDTIEGIKTAIGVCKKHGLKLKGVRLDSGNMSYLSGQARELLDAAGFKQARILASDSVSVRKAASLYAYAAKDVTGRESFITDFGIGSSIAINRDNPLLSLVMKLSARHDVGVAREQLTRELMKVSQDEKKRTIPGLYDVVRYIDKSGRWAGDTIIPSDLPIGEGRLARDIYSESMTDQEVKVFPAGTPFVRLLQPWMKKGKMTQEAYREKDAARILREARATCAASLAKLDPYHLLLSPSKPHPYGVGMAEELSDKRRQVMRHIQASRSLEKQKARFDLV